MSRKRRAQLYRDSVVEETITMDSNFDVGMCVFYTFHAKYIYYLKKIFIVYAVMKVLIEFPKGF